MSESGRTVVNATLVAWLGLTVFSVGAGAGQSADSLATGRLFFLNYRGQVLSTSPDGSSVEVLLDNLKGMPDGIAVDVPNGHIYWSNMGRAADDDGSIERADLDGGGYGIVVPVGGTFTAKQLKLDWEHGKLYWSDREGMRIQRSDIDGSNVETLIVTGKGEAARRDAKNWCVGIALDVEAGQIYWTQKGGDNEGRGRILRANLEIPPGMDPERRQDIDVLFDNLPEPIDLDLDLTNRMIYWTDRGDAPEGNSVNRAPMQVPSGVGPNDRKDREILVSGLDEGIGLALDVRGNRMYFTDLGGNLYSARLDGSEKRTLGTGLGVLTGIAYAEIPQARISQP